MTITTQNGTGAISAPVAGLDTAKLCAPFPPEAIRQRSGGGGKQLSYIEAH